LFYTSAFAASAMSAAIRLGRPGMPPPRWIPILALPISALGAVTAAQLAFLPSGHQRTFWLGATWLQCPLCVFLLSLPVLAGLVWSLRQLAVTRPRQAGAAVGLVAGATGAMLYAFHCTETSSGFVLAWYSLGVAFSSALGALLGPRLFRW
jgi:hypothetical protein